MAKTKGLLDSMGTMYYLVLVRARLEKTSDNHYKEFLRNVP